MQQYFVLNLDIALSTYSSMGVCALETIPLGKMHASMHACVSQLSPHACMHAFHS